MPKLTNELAEKTAQQIARETGDQVQKRVVELLAGNISEEMTDAIAQDVAKKVGPKVYEKVLKNIQTGAFSGEDAEAKPKKTRKAKGEGAGAGSATLSDVEQRFADKLLQFMGTQKSYTFGEIETLFAEKGEKVEKDSVKNIVKVLRANGTLSHEGHARGTRYTVKQLSLPTTTPQASNGSSGTHVAVKAPVTATADDSLA